MSIPTVQILNQMPLAVEPPREGVNFATRNHYVVRGRSPNFAPWIGAQIDRTHVGEQIPKIVAKWKIAHT